MEWSWLKAALVPFSISPFPPPVFLSDRLFFLSFSRLPSLTSVTLQRRGKDFQQYFLSISLLFYLFFLFLFSTSSGFPVCLIMAILLSVLFLWNFVHVFQMKTQLSHKRRSASSQTAITHSLFPHFWTARMQSFDSTYTASVFASWRQEPTFSNLLN